MTVKVEFTEKEMRLLKHIVGQVHLQVPVNKDKQLALGILKKLHRAELSVFQRIRNLF
jgi:hypothetical protein